MIDDGLYVPLHSGDCELPLLTEAHREALRQACAQDQDIWAVYPFNYLGADFEPQFERLLNGGTLRRAHAVLHAGTLVGMTAWIDQAQPGWAIEIGNTYLAPAMRGTGFNTRLKHLMLDHAFACGLDRVVFKVDAINLRSRAAVLKLGAVQEGILRHERRTWTGRVRDTVTFSVLRAEWLARGDA